MFPPDHARRTCPSCGADLLLRADVQPDMLVVYSSLCLACSGGSVPLPQTEMATVPATAGLYWPGRDAAAVRPEKAREAWWDRSSWDSLAVWGRPDPVLPVQRTLGPVPVAEAQPAAAGPPVPHEPTREVTAERRPRAPHVPHPVVSRLPAVAPAERVAADLPSDEGLSAEAIDGSGIGSEWTLWEEMDARAEGSPDSFAFSLPTRGRHARRRKPLPVLRGRLSA